MGRTLKYLVLLSALTLCAGLSAEPRHHRAPHLAPGHTVRVLPHGHRSIAVPSGRYYYQGGVFYRPRGQAYVVARAPIGARVHSLPVGRIGFTIGPRRYFYFNWNYYLWEPRSREYVVVAPPEGAPEAVIAAADSSPGELFAYPKAGQDEAQRERDRYDCHVWAVDQVDYDPGLEGGDVELGTDYRRALSACLEARGYTVR